MSDRVWYRLRRMPDQLTASRSTYVDDMFQETAFTERDPQCLPPTI
jgi:hypothetical protein